jgi:RNA polymerase sigma-70 factor (sigma-E family)
MGGENDDFERVWRLQRDRLWRVAWLICGEADLADDIVASAAARAWSAWGRGRIDDPVAYLRRAVVNEATDRFRRRRRDRRWLTRHTGEGRAATPTDLDVTVRVDVAAALARLPVEQRAVIVLRFWLDLSEQATAETLAIPTGTVKSRTSRALAALGADLNAEATTTKGRTTDG